MAMDAITDSDQSAEHQPVIDIRHLQNYLGGQWVHQDVNLTVQRGEIVCIVGPSGCGKTTVLRSILQLLKPTGGEIDVFGINVLSCQHRDIMSLRTRWGMCFQQSALFSSLTVLENIMFPLQEFSNLPPAMIRELACIKISLAGLRPSAAHMLPSELSGGMKKRAALARAIALDPEVVFLDEPTAGLDPKGAEALDDLVLHLRDNLGLTVLMVTHDLDSLWHIADRVCFLAEGKTIAVLPMEQLVEYDHPLVQNYFGGPRGQLRKR